jgi:tetratricopeptide (TPR) repeat protein/glycosyltransferase involved in cell wall biosynthesis
MSQQNSQTNAQQTATELVHLGDRLLKESKLVEAVEAYQQAIQLKPDSAAFQYKLGHALLQQNELERAEACFRLAVELDDQFHWGHYGLAQVAQRLQQWEQAEVSYRKAIELKPDFSVAVQELAKVLQNLELPASTPSSSDSTVSQNERQQSLQEWIEQGDCLLKIEDFEQAAEAYRQALSIKQDSTTIYYKLGEVKLRLAQFDDAKSLFQKAVELESSSHWGYYGLGRVFIEQGLWDEAIYALQKAIEFKKDFFWSYYNYGQTLFNMQRFDEAIVAYRETIALNPAFPWVYYALGKALAEKSDWEGSVTAYRKALEVKSDFPEAISALNNSLAKRAKSDLQLLRDYYRQAIIHEPENSEYYQKLIDTQPSNPELYLELAADLFLSKKSEAENFIRIALQLEPDLAKSSPKLIKLLNDNQLNLQELLKPSASGSDRSDIEFKSVVQGTSVGELQKCSVEISSSKCKIAVVAWDMSHNPVGRAFLLADLLEKWGDAELLGLIFPQFGTKIWPPLEEVQLQTKSVVVNTFKEFVNAAIDLAKATKYDFVYVCKPRFPSLLIGFLIKYYSQCPLILDIDDHELSFCKDRTTLTFDELVEKTGTSDWEKPFSELWTRFSENLIPHADALTVSNIALQQKYGGIIVRHARNEQIFDPKKIDRQAIRAEFKYSSVDKVILFLGTPRPHKGILRIAEALEKIGDPRIALCIIGTIRDKRFSKQFEKFKQARIDFYEDQPWQRLPELLTIADLICILQDPQDAISEFQIPAKLTDAIAMNIPVLVSKVPPLLDLISSNCVTAVDDDELEQAIIERLFKVENKESDKFHLRDTKFLGEFSYSVNLERVKLAFDLAKQNIQPLPLLVKEVFELVQNQTETKLLIDDPLEDKDSTTAPILLENKKAVNIVFFWKQNDSDIYGRRQDMLVKYLAQDPRVNKILHFDAPISVQKLKEQVQFGSLAKFNQGNQVFANTIERFLGLKDSHKIIKRTFIYQEDSTDADFLGKKLSGKSNYSEYVKQTIEAAGMTENLIAWVCPVVFEFPQLIQDIKFDLIVADIIDNQLKWDIKPSYATKLTENYRMTLEQTDIAFANCENVRQEFSDLKSEIIVVPNGAEIFDDVASWQKPTELDNFEGPIIGYVGNLSDRVDIDLIKYLADKNQQYNFVIIGSAHRNSKIFELSNYKNIHLLGVKVYSEAVRFIKYFDVAIIPHIDNEMTRSMNPLKLYNYYALSVPIVSTKIDNIGELNGRIYVASDSNEFSEHIKTALLKTTKIDDDSRHLILDKINWKTRANSILSKLKEFQVSRGSR